MASAQGILHEGLKDLVFYDQRFAKPLIGAYAGSQVAPYTYISKLFAKVPPQYGEEVAKQTLLRIINECEHCPAPKEVRLMLAESLLKVQQLGFPSSYEKAKLFLAFPPQTKEQAGEWLNKIFFACIRHLGRDRFMVVTPAEWANTITDAVFGDIPEAEYEPRPQETAAAVRHDFKKLLGPH